jgi:hypothetical protein
MVRESPSSVQMEQSRNQSERRQLEQEAHQFEEEKLKEQVLKEEKSAELEVVLSRCRELERDSQGHALKDWG